MVLGVGCRIYEEKGCWVERSGLRIEGLGLRERKGLGFRVRGGWAQQSETVPERRVPPSSTVDRLFSS
jgi:hypothetical protein